MKTFFQHLTADRAASGAEPSAGRCRHLQWSSTGNVRLTIPISRLQKRSMFPVADPLLAEFYKALPADKKHYLQLADFTKWLAALVGLTDKFHQLRDLFSMKGMFYGKLRFIGMLRLTPFINLRSYVDDVAQCGLPVLQSDEILLPPGNTFDTRSELTDYAGADPHLRSLVTVLPLALWALRSIGVPLTTPDPADPTNISKSTMKSSKRCFKPSSQIRRQIYATAESVAISQPFPHKPPCV